MRTRRPAALLSMLAIGLVLSGCGAGGFHGSHEGPPTANPLETYVALGDGFTAAPFLGKTPRARGCLRSARNYPAQVAENLGVELTDVSCVGASTDAVLNASKAPNGKGRLPAQIDAVTEDTDLVTIGIGLSDQRLIYRSFFVCMSLPCAENTIPGKSLADDAAAVEDAVDRIVREVQQRAPGAYIVLVGYPEIIPPDHGCRRLPPVDELQLAGATALFDTVTGAMRNTAFATGARFADLSDATAGHHVCSTEPWVRGIDPPEGAAGALMPLAPEQRAAAKAVLAAVEER